MELLVALAGVLVGAIGVLLQQRTMARTSRQEQSEEFARLIRLEERFEQLLAAGREVQSDLHEVSDRLHCLELQVSRLAGFMSQGRREDG